MSDKHAKESKGKGKGKLTIILVAVAMLALGGGGVFALVATGVIGGSKAAEKKNLGPQFVRKGQEDPYMPKSKDSETDADPQLDVEGTGGDEYRTVYYTFSDEFTSNLKNSDALIQTSLACSTRRDGRVLVWLKKHELAIRSRLLQILADTPEDDVYTIEGKDRLQKRMTAAINQVLIQKEGFGGVDAVYFRSFIIQ